jgi:hypothetical protein
VVQCDADGQHRPAEIPTLLAGIADGAHLVIGSRFAARGVFPAGRARRVGMRMVTGMARRFSGVELTDATSGFRAVGKPLLEEFAADYPTEFLGDTVEAVILAASGGYRITEVPTTMDPRVVGVSRAGAAASGWYVVRLVAAVLLRGGRRASSRSAHRAPMPNER